MDGIASTEVIVTVAVTEPPELEAVTV